MTKKIILSAIIALTLVLGLFMFSNQAVNLGAVNAGEGYTFLNVTSSNASTTSAIAVRGGSGVLGSIVVLSLIHI